MYTARIQNLSLEAFKPYGDYAKLIDPETTAIGGEPIWFYRDMLPLDMKGAGVASFSVCRVLPRPLIVDVGEYHDHTCEGILPLDGDILLHVAVATPGACPADQFEIFRVPMGTMVSLRPGVWHHAPFSACGRPVSTVIVLPERTYKFDCVVETLSGDQRTQIIE